jgi:hypothetical protein
MGNVDPFGLISLACAATPAPLRVAACCLAALTTDPEIISAQPIAWTMCCCEQAVICYRPMGTEHYTFPGSKYADEIIRSCVHSHELTHVYYHSCCKGVDYRVNACPQGNAVCDECDAYLQEEACLRSTCCGDLAQCCACASAPTERERLSCYFAMRDHYRFVVDKANTKCVGCLATPTPRLPMAPSGPCPTQPCPTAP